MGDRRHHHDHGIGNEGAAVCQPRRPLICDTGLSQLCAELCLRSDLYWNNHHHFFHLVRHVNGGMLWADINLLFWVSLVPFATGWMGQNHFAPVPTALYGVALLMPALAFYGLQLVIIRAQGSNPALAQAIGRDVKGKVFAGALCRRYSARVCRHADRMRDLPVGGFAVVHPGPPHRKGGPSPLIARVSPGPVHIHRPFRRTRTCLRQQPWPRRSNSSSRHLSWHVYSRRFRGPRWGGASLTLAVTSPRCDTNVVCSWKLVCTQRPSTKTSTRRNTVACQPGWSCM
jgi:hypothetical protein